MLTPDFLKRSIVLIFSINLQFQDVSFCTNFLSYIFKLFDYLFSRNIGESSAGKSSFLNLLLGEQLLPSAVLNATSTICEIKYGLERKLVVHYKDGDPQTGLPIKSIPLYQSDQSSYLDQISSYVHMKSDREKGSPFTKLEIFWPHEFLKVKYLF